MIYLVIRLLEKFKNLIFLFSICFLFAMSSCEKTIELNGNIVYDPELKRMLYENASDAILIEDQKLILETYLYRNFTPGVLPSEKDPRLIASLSIVNTDSLAISENFKVEKLFVINEEQIWTSIPKTNENDYLPEYKKNIISKNGPTWSTDIYVDVVLKIEDMNTLMYKYLILREQRIDKVE